MTRINIASKKQIIGSETKHIVLIGAGNVSTHLSRHLHSAGHGIKAIYSRNIESANLLAKEFDAIGTDDPEEVPQKADFFIVCLPDQVISEVAMRFQDHQGIWLHTAGACSIGVFEDLQDHYGVMYPLQTLSRKRPVNLEEAPFLIEGSSQKITALILHLASSITRNVFEMDSASRLVLHLAAVFANNFSNHMVHLAQQILEEQDIDVKLLNPILKETFNKMVEMGAAESQTGPAMRGDVETMQKHVQILKEHPEWENLYTFISRDIGGSWKE